MIKHPILKKLLVVPVIKHLGFILALLFLHAVANAQISISGTIVDSALKPISGATVYYTATNSDIMLGFTRSDKDGRYILKIKPQDPDTILLHYLCIGYWDKTIKLKAAAANIKCTLNRAETKLADIVVKNAAIKQYGDSINYNTASFTDKNDRSIGDVLKKMPGITVGEDGQIKYQGNAIQKLTVNGLNLMEGRYGVITNNLPAAAVNKVQVVENDQPIRILDSLVPSKGTSINLKLKKITTTSNGETGIGLTPFLRDVTLSHMAFLKNFQTINTFASNNVGKNQSVLFNNFLPGGSMYYNSGEALPRLVSAGVPATPPLSSIYWLSNNINLFSSNSILKTLHNWELKINLGYYTDKQQQQANSITQLLTSNQTINVAETKQSTVSIKAAFANYVIEKNTKKLFFRNNFSIDQKTQTDTNNITNNSSFATQQVNYKKLSLANKLTIIVPAGRQLVTINSQFSYSRMPELLSIQPVPFKGVFNNNTAYNLNQHVLSRAIKLDNYLELTKSIGNFSFSPKIGYSFEHTTLKSFVNLQDSLYAPNNTSYFANSTNYWLNQLYASLGVHCKYRRWVLVLTTPISVTDLKLTTPAAESNRRPAFLPNFYGEYKVTPDFFISVFTSRSNNWPGITSFFRNYIISDYRSIGKNNTPLAAEQKMYDYTAGAEYKNTAAFLFLNGSITYSYGSSNFIDSTEINSNGAVLSKTVMFNNTFQSTNIVFGVSKTIIAAHTTLKFNSNLNITQQRQFLNGAITPLASSFITLKGFVTTTLTKYLIVDYMGTFNYGKSKAKQLQSNVYTQAINHVSVSLSPTEKHVINLSTDAYTATDARTRLSALVNVYYRIKLMRIKTDLYVYCNNIFNTTYYSSFYSWATVMVQSNYLLRPRQVGVSYKFMF